MHEICDRNRGVARTKITEDIEVSTVFLGLDHNHWNGPPLLFETLVFGGEFDQEMDRYETWDQALEGHRKIVEKIENSLGLVDLIKKINLEDKK